VLSCRQPCRRILPLEAQRWSLDDKYLREEGTVYLSGIQALVRVTLDQHRLDRRRGLRTATLVCGYRGSPLGGVDVAFERAAAIARAHEVRFVNASTRSWRRRRSSAASLPHPPRGEVRTASSACGTARAPASIDLATSSSTRTRRGGKERRCAGVGRPTIRRARAPPSPAERAAFWAAGFPVLYPGSVQEVLDLGLHGYALSALLGPVGRVKCATPTCATRRELPRSPRIAWRPIGGAPSEIAGGSLLFLRCAAVRALLAGDGGDAAHLGTGDGAQVCGGNGLNCIVARSGGDAHRDHRRRKDLVRPAPGDARPGARRRGVAEGRGAAAQGRHAVSARARHRPRIRRGARGDPGGGEEALLPELLLREVLYGAPQRPRIVGKLDEAGTRLRAIVRRAGRRLDRADRRGAPRRTSTARSQPARGSRRSMPCAGGRRRSRLRAAHTSAAAARTTLPPSSRRDRSPAAASVATRWRSAWPLRRRPHAHGRGGSSGSALPSSPARRTLFQNIGDGTLFHSRHAGDQGRGIWRREHHVQSALQLRGGDDGGQQAAGALPVPAARPPAPDRRSPRGGRRLPTSRRSTARVIWAARRSTRATSWTRCNGGCARSPGSQYSSTTRNAPRRSAGCASAGKRPDPPMRVFIDPRGLRGLRRLWGQVELPVGAADRHRAGPQDAQSPVVLQQGLLLPRRRLPVVPHRGAHRRRASAAEAEAARSASGRVGAGAGAEAACARVTPSI